MHMRIHIHIYDDNSTYTNTYSYACALTYTYTYTYAFTFTFAYTHTYAYTYAYTYAFTYTNTFTYVYVYISIGNVDCFLCDARVRCFFDPFSNATNKTPRWFLLVAKRLWLSVAVPGPSCRKLNFEETPLFICLHVHLGRWSHTQFASRSLQILLVKWLTISAYFIQCWHATLLLKCRYKGKKPFEGHHRIRIGSAVDCVAECGRDPACIIFSGIVCPVCPWWWCSLYT